MSSPRVVIGGSIVRNAAAVRPAGGCARSGEGTKREKGSRSFRERGSEIFPHRLEKPTPHQLGTVGAGGGGGGVEETRGGLRGRRKEGDEEGYPGWSRWWLGAAASKIHRNHTARLHRRSRHLPPPNRNETARVKHPILLPPSRSCPATRRSNGQVKNHHRRDGD